MVEDIMNIVFDANAFYAYYGREKLELDLITMIDEDKFIKEMHIVEKIYCYIFFYGNI